MWFTHKNNIIRGLVVGDDNIFVMEERQVFSNIGSLKIDVERVLIDSLSVLIIICISDLTLFTHSERVSKSSFSRFAHCLA